MRLQVESATASRIAGCADELAQEAPRRAPSGSASRSRTASGAVLCEAPSSEQLAHRAHLLALLARRSRALDELGELAELALDARQLARP